MKTPTNQTAEILYEILNNPSVSRKDILINTGVLNPTARIADLRIRHGIDISCEVVRTVNKFSRIVKYGRWSIRGKENIERAHAVYDKINVE